MASASRVELIRRIAEELGVEARPLIDKFGDASARRDSNSDDDGVGSGRDDGGERDAVTRELAIMLREMRQLRSDVTRALGSMDTRLEGVPALERKMENVAAQARWGGAARGPRGRALTSVAYRWPSCGCGPHRLLWPAAMAKWRRRARSRSGRN